MKKQPENMSLKKKIALGIAVFAGFATIGFGLTKYNAGRCRHRYRKCQADKTIVKLMDRNFNGKLEEIEERPLYMCIRGDVYRRGDCKLNFKEKNKWLADRGYKWDSTSKTYRNYEEEERIRKQKEMWKRHDIPYPPKELRHHRR